MAKKTTAPNTPKDQTDRLFEESPEIIAIESPDRDIQPSDVPVREDPESEHLEVSKPKNRLQRFFAWFWRKKWLTIPGLIVVIAAILLAIPMTRYGLTSWFWKESIVISVTDNGNRQPVSEATVIVAGQTVKTDKDGKAKFAAIPVGDQKFEISKKHYKSESSTVTVPWFAQGHTFDQTLQATGRVIDLSVTHKITGDALANVAIAVANEAQAHTDDKGIAHLVIPADKTELAITLAIDGFNTSQVTIKQGDKNQFQLTPSGRVFLLSKQSGDIDVVSTNLDGTDRKVVVEGTGNEENVDTHLLASRDWKYLILHAKREANKPAALYLIDTSKGNLEVLDQGNVNFSLAGWSGHNFFYSLYRQDKKPSENGVQAVKVYNAPARKLTMIDESQAVSIGVNSQYYQSIGGFYITDNNVVYHKVWSNSGYITTPLPTDKVAEIMRVASDGTGKKVLKSYPSQSISHIESKLYAPQEIYFRIVSSADKSIYAEFEDGVFHDGVDGAKFNSQYPTFIMSPNGNQSFWSESRDGKFTLLTGDKNANNKQELVGKSEYQAYGWYTDNYILMQKGGSELYITTAKQLKAGVAPLKISDYHKPTSISGYGYGYGGQ